MSRPAPRIVLGSLLLSLVLLASAFASEAVKAQPSSDGKLEASVLEAKVSRGVLNVKISLKNTSGALIEPEIPYGRSYYVDFKEKKKYPPLKDPQGRYLAGPQHYGWGGGTFKERIPPGEQRLIWIKFPAPAPTSEKLDIVLPGILPLEEMTIEVAGEGKKGDEAVEAAVPAQGQQPGLPITGVQVDIVGLSPAAVSGVTADLDKTIRDLGGKKVGQEIQVSLSGDLLFDFDKWNIKKEAEETLSKLAKLIEEVKKRRVIIEGHTDSKGSESYNAKLSEKRALAVKDWFMTKGGLGQVKFQIKGYGEGKPVAPNTKPDGTDNPEGRAKNRRVEVRIMG